jgi:hypothetical protein
MYTIPLFLQDMKDYSQYGEDNGYVDLFVVFHQHLREYFRLLQPDEQEKACNPSSIFHG